MAGQPAGFLSYVRKSDALDGGLVSKLFEQIELAVQVAGVPDFRIFRDEKDVQWGENWAARLEESVRGAFFLFPVLVPAWFQSEWCRRELEAFLEVERQRGRSDLIFPVYWMTCRQLEDPARREEDPLARAISARQFVDWRELRLEETLATAKARRAVGAMAERIAAAVEGATQGAPTSTGRDPIALSQPAPPKPKLDGRPALVDLLLSLFSADELRRFLRYGPQGDSVSARLPGANASPAALATEAVEVLARDGGIDAAFFARLGQERPRRMREIGVVEALFDVRDRPPPPSA